MVATDWTSGDHRKHAHIEHQLAGFIAFVGAIHQQRKALGHGTQLFKQGAPVRRIVLVAGRQRKDYGRPSIRGHHRNLGVVAVQLEMEKAFSQ
jgi:hypothetical protein